MGHITLSLWRQNSHGLSASAAGKQMVCLGPAEACEAEPRHEPPVWQILLKLGWILAASCHRAWISNTVISPPYLPLFFFYSVASAKIFSHPADPLWSKKWCWSLAAGGRFDTEALCTGWILCLHLQQVEGIKRPDGLVYNFMHLNVTVYDRIQSDQLYIHRETQN